MSEVEAFLTKAASVAGVAPHEVLARVLHVGDGAFSRVVAAMDEQTRTLAIRLDHEFRVRNPGLHYVERQKFLGYRREGAAWSPKGERSQIFASLILNSTRLEVVLPVNSDSIDSVPNASDLSGKGHHGVGDVRVLIASDREVDRFLADFEYWLVPGS